MLWRRRAADLTKRASPCILAPNPGLRPDFTKELSGLTDVTRRAWDHESMKILIGVVLVAVVLSLGSALFQMTSRHGDPAKVNAAFAWRIAFSALLVVLLLASWKFGLLE